MRDTKKKQNKIASSDALPEQQRVKPERSIALGKAQTLKQTKNEEDRKEISDFATLSFEEIEHKALVEIEKIDRARAQMREADEFAIFLKLALCDIVSAWQGVSVQAKIGDRANPAQKKTRDDDDDDDDEAEGQRGEEEAEEEEEEEGEAEEGEEASLLDRAKNFVGFGSKRNTANTKKSNRSSNSNVKRDYGISLANTHERVIEVWLDTCETRLLSNEASNAIRTREGTRAFAIVARSYQKTLSDLGFIGRSIAPLRNSLDNVYPNSMIGGNGKMITFLHAIFYQACFEAKCSNRAYEDVLKNGKFYQVEDPTITGFTAKDFANYSYYAGLACLDSGDYERSISFFSDCVSMPSTKDKCTRTQLSSYKKLILAAIIQTGETSSFLSQKSGIPAKTSPNVRMTLLQQAPLSYALKGGSNKFGGGGGWPGGGNNRDDDDDDENNNVIKNNININEAADVNNDQNNDGEILLSSGDEGDDEEDIMKMSDEVQKTPPKMTNNINDTFELNIGEDIIINNDSPEKEDNGDVEMRQQHHHMVDGDNENGDDESDLLKQQSRSPYQLLIDVLKLEKSQNNIKTPLQRFTEAMYKYKYVFEQDGNFDLVQLAYESVKLAQVRKIAETYSSLSLEMIASEMNLQGGAKDAEKLINDMVTRSLLNDGVLAKISPQGMVTFHEKVEDAEALQRKLEKTMKDVDEMTRLIKQFEQSMVTDEKYFVKFHEKFERKTRKTQRGGGGNRDNGIDFNTRRKGGGGNNSNLFDEELGIF